MHLAARVLIFACSADRNSPVAALGTWQLSQKRPMYRMQCHMLTTSCVLLSLRDPLFLSRMVKARSFDTVVAASQTIRRMGSAKKLRESHSVEDRWRGDGERTEEDDVRRAARGCSDRHAGRHAGRHAFGGVRCSFCYGYGARW